jgi:hypothetical protein
MIVIMFRAASDAATLAVGPAFASPTSPAPAVISQTAVINEARVPRPGTAKSNALVGSCCPASQEHIRVAAYDAVEKVLNGLLQPLSPQALSTRWNEAAEAMAKHLAAEHVGRSDPFRHGRRPV